MTKIEAFFVHFSHTFYTIRYIFSVESVECLRTISITSNTKIEKIYIYSFEKRKNKDHSSEIIHRRITILSSSFLSRIDSRASISRFVAFLLDARDHSFDICIPFAANIAETSLEHG